MVARITAVRDAARLLEDARFGGAGTLSRTWGVRRGVFLRLAADIASGDADASEADMRTVLALLRDARSALTDPGLRAQFAQDRKTIMDTTIDLLAATEG